MDQRQLVILVLRNGPLELSAVLLLAHGDVLEGVNLVNKLVFFLCHREDLFVGLFQVVGNVINMSLKSQDFLNEVFLALLHLGDLIRGTADILLGVLKLRVEIAVLSGNLFNRRLEPLDLKTGVSIISEDILLLKFERP